MSVQPPLRTRIAETPEARWFAEEVHPHDASLKAYLRTSFPLVRDVDDVVQESYLRIWKAKLAQPIRSTKSFLFQIARNLTRDKLRRDRCAPIVTVADFDRSFVLDEGPSTAEIACTRDELKLLAAAIDRLPARCREIMILRQIEGLSQKEIAARLGISVLTVQVHVVKGLRRIREYLGERGVGETRR